MDSSVKRRS
ncbi:hypothetical protein EYF80_067337 [Liparis tanakae]|uniref:Uncharacterized protein n=1 Tax=Liparis tanakae TaxID=230148 RepID=A0A4Z2E1C3_9TELE|nr:hypothetical protein EYF80_067337 [Liparis tanakae]